MIPGLNKHSHMPLYRQLVEHLIGQIDEGELATGSRVPSERELAEDLGVSRTTARLAIDELVTSGIVYREQGRGTFVAEPRMHSLQGFASFSTDVLARGMQPRSRVLKLEVINPDPTIRKKLRLGPVDTAIHLVRLRLADDTPVAIQEAYLPESIVPGLADVDLEDRSLFDLLRDQYYIYPAWTEAEVTALTATEDESSLLGLDSQGPVLVVTGLTFTDSFEVVEAVRTVYPGGGFGLYIGRQRFAPSRTGGSI